ncbi:MAG: hypothetical protein BAA03_10895 [Caldibacillus debilis]|nr:MAG: hypothetical protein BAA03_10895 [Caldibacillus debilis]
MFLPFHPQTHLPFAKDLARVFDGSFSSPRKDGTEGPNRHVHPRQKGLKMLKTNVPVREESFNRSFKNEDDAAVLEAEGGGNDKEKIPFSSASPKGTGIWL